MNKSEISTAKRVGSLTQMKAVLPGFLKGVLRGFIIMYILIGLLIWTPLYDAIIERPFAADRQAYWTVRKQPVCKEYFITVNGADKLHAWLFRLPRAKRLFIVHHGNAGNILHRIYLANAAIMCGESVLLYDYRGYGLSTGLARLSGLVEDGRAVYDFAVSRLGYSPKQIVNFGESLGTGVACHLAATRPSAGLVLQSPVGSLPALGRKHFVICWPYPDFAFPQPHFNNAEDIRQVRVPVLLLHGTKDTLVPYQHSQLILSNASAPKRLVLLDGYGHNDMPADGPAYQRALKTFLDSLPR